MSRKIVAVEINSVCRCC